MVTFEFYYSSFIFLDKEKHLLSGWPMVLFIKGKQCKCLPFLCNFFKIVIWVFFFYSKNVSNIKSSHNELGNGTKLMLQAHFIYFLA